MSESLEEQTHREDLMNDTKHRVAQIGCGQKGTSHARSHMLVGRSEIVAAADPDEENLALFCERFGVPGYTDHRELLEKEEFEIASAILNPRNNPGIVIDCAQAGGIKAIQSEKPIAERLSDADAMVAACKANGVWYACGDVERNWSYYWKAREVIESGELGEVLSVTCFSVSARRWDVQGLSLTRMFAFDADVAWVTGWVHDDAVSDYDTGGYSGHLRFTNGIDAYLHRRTGARDGIEVVCTEGVFESDHRYMRIRKAGDQSEAHWTRLSEMTGIFPEESFQGIRVGEYDDDGWRHPGTRCLHTVESLIDAVEDGHEPRSNGDNGRKTLEITIALRESHRRGHIPVRLPLEVRDQVVILGHGVPLDKKDSEGRASYMEKLRDYTR